jgi:Fic family protein
MPLQVTQKEWNRILQVVADFPGGASISQLLDSPVLQYPRRTLQRRLDKLVETEQIKTLGNHRTRVYLIPTPSQSTIPLAEWMCEESKEIREILSKPISIRHPVGYNPDFLDRYTPNKTHYLPQQTREQLAQIGEVGISNLPAGTYIRQILDRLLIDLSWNSSRLEGNTYTLLETHRLLELEEEVTGKAAIETQMIINHKRAIEMLADEAAHIGFNRYTLCNLHALLSDNLLNDPASCGRLRSRSVGISGTVFHPLDLPQAIEMRFLEVLKKATAIQDAFEQAFFVMVHLPYLQAFDDVNKRVSRLAANIPLIKHNLCPLSFIDVERDDYITATLGVYELERIEYLRDVFVWAYQRSCVQYSAIRQSLGKPDPFRIRYRLMIERVIRKIVQETMDRQQAKQWITQQATQDVTPNDAPKFKEVIETELNSLHEGNIVRYRLRPSEFVTWFSAWKSFRN